MSNPVEIKKFIDNELLPTVNMMISSMNNPPNNEDPVMYRIRTATYLFNYFNSIPDYIIMSPELMDFRSATFKQCEQLKKEGEDQIQVRIKAALKVLPSLRMSNPRHIHTPESIRTYYMTFLNNMLTEMEHFKTSKLSA